MFPVSKILETLVNASIAQSAECILGKDEVVGSIPIGSSILKHKQKAGISINISLFYLLFFIKLFSVLYFIFVFYRLKGCKKVLFSKFIILLHFIENF